MIDILPFKMALAGNYLSKLDRINKSLINILLLWASQFEK